MVEKKIQIKRMIEVRSLKMAKGWNLWQYKDKEIDHVDYDRWMGVAAGLEKITFKDGSVVIFKCDIRHYRMADNPDTAIREAIAYQIDKIVELGLIPKNDGN